MEMKKQKMQKEKCKMSNVDTKNQIYVWMDDFV